MLSYIHIKNIAIIEETEVEFSEGLNVLTGETGVGKSIIINSINFALGGRANRDMIRNGASSASCEMIFDLNDENVAEVLKLENIDIEDNQIVISRTLTTSGRNVFKINGTVVSSNVMKNITGKIIDIHGQHEHQSLFDVSKHIDILDRFCTKEISSKKEELKVKYDEYKSVLKKISSMLGNDGERERKIDLLSFQINEIEEMKLIKDEDVSLMAKRNMMINADKIVTSLNSAYEDTCIADTNISNAINSLEKILKIDDYFSKMYDSLNEAQIIVSEAKGDISSYADDISFDSSEQAKIEERLDDIDRLKRKYGSTIEDIYEYKKRAEEDLDNIINSESILKKLKSESNKIKEEIDAIALEISGIRKKNAKVIEEAIIKNLQDLEMKNARFVINIKEKLEVDQKGIDDVEFLFSSNLGENVKALEKIASGGEISRVMLAIKNVLAGNDEIQILIFDEIDTGISGKAAQKVAEKMNELARGHQILCITHLPQIASMADYHYEICKEIKEDRTISNIKLINDDESIKEIARLIAGAEITDLTMMHAKELKKQADSFKGK